MNQQPVPKQSNNGVLNSTNAMPMKNITSDNDATFGLNRMLFNRSYQPKVDYSQTQISNSVIERESPGMHHGFVIDGTKTANQKKWIGGNRDASDIINRRRMNTTGASINAPGAKSFKNPTDNNPRVEALARVRGGGARVPPKVANRPVSYPSIPSYFRIVSAGLIAVNPGGTIKESNIQGGIYPGFYSYTPANLNGSALATYNLSFPNRFQISYNVLTINRKTGSTTFRNYDIFNGGTTTATAMANYLNGLDSSVIVIIATYDEPKFCTEPNLLPSDFILAMQNCGASSNFGSYTDGSSGTGILKYRSAYILVGVPRIGVGNGLQFYKGSIDGAQNAFIDLRISVFNGQYTVISCSA